MRIDLTDDGGSGLVVTWEGKPVCDLTVPPPQSFEDWQKDQRRWHSLINVAAVLARLVERADEIQRIKDENHKTGRKKEEAWGRGFVDGLCGRVQAHSLPGVPPVMPENSPAYVAGYETGECVRKVHTIQTDA